MASADMASLAFFFFSSCLCSDRIVAFLFRDPFRGNGAIALCLHILQRLDSDFALFLLGFLSLLGGVFGVNRPFSCGDGDAAGTLDENGGTDHDNQHCQRQGDPNAAVRLQTLLASTPLALGVHNPVV